jgi:TolA-binding protein
VEIVVVVAASAALALAALAVSVLLARRQAGLEAVEEVLARRQADHQARIATLEERLVTTDDRLAALEERVAALDDRFATLEARVAALEEARRAQEVEAGRRARVRAWFDRSFRVLHLTNDGPAPARGVTVELRLIGAGRPPALDLGGLPVDLRPGQQLYLDAQEPSPDGAAALTATVRWTDDTGARDETFVLGTRF